jgi:DNA-binding transcriptional LysR family regulator
LHSDDPGIQFRYHDSMDHLGTLSAFVQAAETGSFVAAGRKIGLTASAVGKGVARLELRLGVRLFHRDTRNMTLTEEGRLFLDRCRRIFEEVEAAEMELTKTAIVPSGRLRISLPLGGMFLMPIIGDFIEAFPAILLDLDFSDRLVDVIEEGFDVVIRTGASSDSGLMRRSFGRFTGRLVASPEYLARQGTPTSPADLMAHSCLRQRSPATGKLHDWALRDAPVALPETMSANTIAPLIELALRGGGIAFLPPFAVNSRIDDGGLIPLLGDYVIETGELAALWPTNRQLSPRIRAFVDFMADRLDLAA